MVSIDYVVGLRPPGKQRHSYQAGHFEGLEITLQELGAKVRLYFEQGGSFTAVEYVSVVGLALLTFIWCKSCATFMNISHALTLIFHLTFNNSTC